MQPIQSDLSPTNPAASEPISGDCLALDRVGSVARPRSGELRMRAMRLEGPGLAPRLEMLPVPRPREGEALLRVLAAGVCHTELQLIEGNLNPGVWPLTPGHEIVGEVVAGAPELLGQRVLVYDGRPCGECAWCAQDQEQVCPNAGAQPGLSTDGGFAEYVCVPVECLVALADTLDPVEAAPLGCAAATAFHALHSVAGVQPGESVAVYGIGGLGLPLIQLGLARGARVLAIGRSPGKLALARELGAEVVDASAGDPVLDVRRLTRGEGVHVVFDLVGSDESMPAALQMLRRQGRLVFVGYGSARFQVNPLQLVLRETRLFSSLGNTRAELREVVRLAAAGALRVPIAASYALEGVAKALESLRTGQVVGRAVVVPALAPRHAEARETAFPSKVHVILSNEASASRLTPGVWILRKLTMTRNLVMPRRRSRPSSWPSSIAASTRRAMMRSSTLSPCDCSPISSPTTVPIVCCASAAGGYQPASHTGARSHPCPSPHSKKRCSLPSQLTARSSSTPVVPPCQSAKAATFTPASGCTTATPS